MEKKSNKRKEECSSSSSLSLSLSGELQQGKEFARQLQFLLNNPQSSGAGNTRPEFLVHQIIASFDRAVSIAHHPELPLNSDSPLSGAATCSTAGSENSDPVGDHPDPKTSSRNNKGEARWKVKVAVSAETGFEGPPGDGYNWRKYGQKEILNAEYHRAYYRCALKNHTNCSATKQVQRCDHDPSSFEVTYKGHHTCNQSVTNPPHPPPSSSHHNRAQSQGIETLISFDPQHPDNTNPCLILQQNTDSFHNQQHAYVAASNPNPTGFQFHAGPTTATSIVPAVASATSSPIDFAHEYPFDPFDFDNSIFFQ